VLDIGAGGGDSAVSLRRSLADRGWTPRITIADRHAATLGLAARRVAERDGAADYEFVRLEGEALPFRDGAFDLVLCSTVLHHLEDAAAGALLRETERVTSVGWIVADLRRSRVALAAVRLLASTLWRRSALPRVDGPVSVRRSFTPLEIRALLDRDGSCPAVIESGPIRWVAWRAHPAEPPA
jgi:ubiquinone/menaquinone biosynthesis C-methylase UbiE